MKNPKNIEKGKKGMAKRWKGHERVHRMGVYPLPSGESAGYFEYRGEGYSFRDESREAVIKRMTPVANAFLLKGERAGKRMFEKARTLLEIK